MRSIYKAQAGMKVKKDPPKGYKYTESGDLVPVGWSEFHDESDNYLNLAALDSIVQAPYPDSNIQFSEFRDQVRTVEAGPDSPDPYRQRQIVTVGGVDVPVGVGRGAYQFDYPTAQTAYNRIKQIAEKRGMDYPQISDDELRDVSSLDPEIQDMLFTAHFAKDKASSVGRVLSDKGNWADEWYKGHYKGDDASRLKHFKDLME